MKCPHLVEAADIEQFSNNFTNLGPCVECNCNGPNLWVCLHRKCQNVGCSEQNHDHSTLHFKRNSAHCVHMNLSSQRVWCFKCSREVFSQELNDSAEYTSADGRSQSDNDDDKDEVCDLTSSSTATLSAKSMSGLVGLQNIANTCYMNSALQALSNVRPMTYYFLKCGDLVEHFVDQSMAAHRTKAGLAKSYQRLIYDIWLNTDDAKDYIAPRGILYGIRSVHPMFRGFQQHDTQEFLRCFMDQLHEELKEQDPIAKPNSATVKESRDDCSTNEEDETTSISSSDSRCSSTLSITEYETCESSLSTEDTPRNAYVKPIKRASLQSERSHKLASHSNSPMTSSKSKSSTTTTTLPQATPSARSIISDIFDGKLLSSVQCLTCDRISTREETFQDLSLPIPNRDYLNVLHQTHSASAQSLNLIDSAATRVYGEGWISWLWGYIRSWLWGPSVTLHDCMASFFSADELKGDNMYSCEKCNKLRTGVKYSQILDLPEVLCIHLKRFRHDLSYSSKISSHVHFPLEGFDMRPYLHKDCTSRVSLYNLASIICHHGTVGSGHYTCLARNAMNNRWYEYDDHRVTEVTPEMVQNCQAYVLFYHKHNPQIELIRAEANDLCISNPVRTADIRFYISQEWLVRFNTFSEPGPIDNWTILCPHGGILQTKIDVLSRIAVPISQPLWDFLYCKYGGGPVINVLFECEICKRASEALTQRRLYELSAFTKYNNIDADIESCAIFAISMPWLRKWQQFVRGTTNKEPGPITNANISATNDAASVQPTRLIQNVRSGSDYAQLSAPQWKLLHQIYGGGPEILLRGSIIEDEHDDITDSAEPAPEVETFENQTVSHEHMNGLSDTESNIAEPADKHSSNTQSETTNEEVSSLNNESSHDGRHSSEHTKNSRPAYHIVYSKMKPKASAFRKHSKRSRNALKNAELFGPKGHFNTSASSEATLVNGTTHSYDSHSVEDDDRSDSGLSRSESRQSSTHMPSERPEKRRGRKHFGEIPLSRSSNKVHKSKSQDNVMLKKFVPLDSNESLETDA